MESVSIKALGTRVQISGASLINYQTTLVLFGTRNKHLSDKLDHVQRNTSRLIEGNDTPFENGHKTPNFPTSKNEMKEPIGSVIKLFHTH